MPLWRVTLVSAAFSLAIEVTQGLAGNGRAADADVIMNALGGACGWALGRVALVAMARWSHDRPDTVSPGGPATGP
ncbi:MAG: VanZ family protein [Chloroflexota bacterium]